MLTDHDGYSEDYLENAELNRSIFLNFSSADHLLAVGLPQGIFLLHPAMSEVV